VSERESKSAKVDDLDKPVTDTTAEQVKGGASVAPTVSPILVKQINPRSIVPCV